MSDFDGTLTQRDFYRLAAETLLPGDGLEPWYDYRAGRISHFEGLRRIFARLTVSEDALADVLRQMEIEPKLGELLAALRAEGWGVIVASAGCRWYIDRLLASQGVQLVVYANPGEFSPSTGLTMRLPTDSEFFTPSTGVDKPAIVRWAQSRADEVAFCGDGTSDLSAALLVAPALRFARGDLAQQLSAQGESFVNFQRWSDVVQALLRREVRP